MSADDYFDAPALTSSPTDDDYFNAPPIGIVDQPKVAEDNPVLGLAPAVDIRPFASGLLRGAADFGNTILNHPGAFSFGQIDTQPPVDVPFGGLSKAARDEAVQQYQGSYGNSPGALLGRIVGSAALTANPIARISAVGETIPFINAMRSGGLLARTGGNALVGAVQGAAASTSTSGGYEQPASEQIGIGALLGGTLGAAGPAIREGTRGTINMLFGKSGSGNALAETAVNQLGIPLRASQISDSKPISLMDSLLQKIPFSGMKGQDEEISKAFTRAAGKTMGADADALTESVVRQAKSNIGQKFEQVASGVTNMADATLGNELVSIKDGLGRIMTEQEAAPLARNIDDIFKLLDQNQGALSGKEYQTLVKNGSPLDRLSDHSNSTISEEASRIKDALDDALERHSPQDLRDTLREARYQWKNYITLKPLLEKAQAHDGQIQPALLFERARKVWGDLDTGNGGELGQLAKIGQRFLKPESSSHTAEYLGAGAALSHPGLWPAAIAAIVGGRATGTALRSKWLRNRLLNPGVPVSNNPLLNLNVPMMIEAQQAIPPSVANAQ